MSENVITLTLGDWLYNAGIVGLVNILEHSKEGTVSFNNQDVSFNLEELENFEDKFFNYFIDTYEKTLAWSKVVSYKEKIESFKIEKFKNFDKDSLEGFNKYVENLKKYLKNKSHISAYKLIKNKYPVLEKEKEIKKVNLKKKENVEDRIQEIKSIMAKIIEVIDFYSEVESRKYIAGKNVIYTIIKNAWNGVSFSNTQNERVDKKTNDYVYPIEIRDIYLNYRNYFPKDAKQYISLDKSNYEYNCITCDSKINNLDLEMNFLNLMGFDTDRKSSHAWNFENHIAICPICKLVYSCVPAGFNYVYDRGIFINDNNSSKNIVDISTKLKYEIFADDNLNANSTFKSIIIAIQEKTNDSFKYEMADIQVIRYENEKYRFNILSKSMLKVIRESEEELNKIIRCKYEDKNNDKENFRPYEEVIKNIFNNANQFLLIHKLLVYKLGKPENTYYHLGHLKDIITINFNFLKGVGYMGDKEKKNIWIYNKEGKNLKEAYKDSENKLQGICYRLLNALKTNNSGMFMDVILNCYLYVGKQVPTFFTDCLKGNEELKTIGYSFISGLIDEKKSNGNEEGDNK